MNAATFRTAIFTSIGNLHRCLSRTRFGPYWPVVACFLIVVGSAQAPLLTRAATSGDQVKGASAAPATQPIDSQIGRIEEQPEISLLSAGSPIKRDESPLSKWVEIQISLDNVMAVNARPRELAALPADSSNSGLNAGNSDMIALDFAADLRSSSGFNALAWNGESASGATRSLIVSGGAAAPSNPPVVGSGTSVPEPTGLSVVLIAAVAICRSRR